MKALTLHQPWASLVALGVKTIETRSWSTKYRGPLAIHAGLRIGQRPLGSWWWVNTESGHVLWSEGGKDHPRSEPMPLGAIVATCELVDVVPIDLLAKGSHIGDFPHDGPLPHQQGGLWLIGNSALNRGTPTRIEDQRPYGDFTPGRYAWLLGDIWPVELPVPCKGRQGLWNVPEGLLEGAPA